MKEWRKGKNLETVHEKFPELVSHEPSVSRSTATKQTNKNKGIFRREIKNLENAKGKGTLKATREKTSSTTQHQTDGRFTTATQSRRQWNIFKLL